ncbi:MAG: XdhC family protein [Verrucomicrobiota bacterium]
MEEIWAQLQQWIEQGKKFALATVIEVQRSSPRGVGACLAVSEDGTEFIGSVSAGCVENEVIEAAKQCLKDGQTRFLAFGPDIGYPWEVSLSCGGKIGVRIEPYFKTESSELAQSLHRDLNTKQVCLLASSPSGHFLVHLDGSTFSSGEALSDEIKETARSRLHGNLDTEELEIDGQRILFRMIRPQPRLFIIGAVHIAIHLVQIAKPLNYETVVIDPRSIYAQDSRFPLLPTQLVDRQPREFLAGQNIGPQDCGVALTHDPKIDDQALEQFLHHHCGYIGALGSRKSHSARLRRLEKKGFDQNELSKINGPVGLDIGSRTPAEIAVSIMAEIIATKSGKVAEQSLVG